MKGDLNRDVTEIKTYSAYSGFCRCRRSLRCGSLFIRKGKADLETDFDDFKDEFEEEEPAPAERTYTTLPKTKGAEDAAPDPESAACNKGSETADTEAESETAESEEEDAEKKAVRIVKFLHRKKAK